MFTLASIQCCSNKNNPIINKVIKYFQRSEGTDCKPVESVSRNRQGS